MAVCTILSILDLSPADAAVGEVMDGKFFFAVEEPIKEGTMPTQTLDPANENVPAGYYAATTLSAVDGDLAVGNIKDGVMIFGFTGTFESVLAEDVLGYMGNQDIVGSSGTYYRHAENVLAGADFTLATKDLNYNDPSLTVGTAVCFGSGSANFKLRLIMDGVQVAESGNMTGVTDWLVVQGTRALTGVTTCFAQLHNYAGEIPQNYYTYGATADLHMSGEIILGSVKI